MNTERQKTAASLDKLRTLAQTQIFFLLAHSFAYNMSSDYLTEL